MLIYITSSWVIKSLICNRKIEKSQENNSEIQRSFFGLSQVESFSNLAFGAARPAERGVTKPKQWTQQLRASSVDSGIGVTVDFSNNIYVTGFTSGGIVGNDNSVGNDIFLVKYNSNCVKY